MKSYHWEKILALKKNGIWEISDLPNEKNPMGCKQIFIVKNKADRIVDRFKA